MLGIETSDQIDDVEEAAAEAVADQSAGNGDGQMRLARSGADDEDGIALVGDEGSVGEVADQRLVDRRAVEVELLDVLCERRLLISIRICSTAILSSFGANSRVVSCNSASS